MALPRFSQQVILDLMAAAEADIDLDMSTYYLITWNPNPKPRKAIVVTSSNPDQQYDYHKTWMNMLVGYIQHLKRCSNEFCIVPEISDSGRLHIHGWFKMSDKIKWQKSVHGKFYNNGRLKFNKMNSLNSLEYYRKSIDNTMHFLDSRHIVVSHDTIGCVMSDIRLMKHNLATDTPVVKKLDLEKLFSSGDIVYVFQKKDV